MSPEQIEEALKRIDAVISPPETETDEDRERRRIWVERDAEARRIRKGKG